MAIMVSVVVLKKNQHRVCCAPADFCHFAGSCRARGERAARAAGRGCVDALLPRSGRVRVLGRRAGAASAH
eukprot:1315856-Prymnesium_polylepis.1